MAAVMGRARRARATAIDELVKAGILDTPGADTIATQFTALDVSTAVDTQLARLRSEIAPSAKGTAGA